MNTQKSQNNLSNCDSKIENCQSEQPDLNALKGNTKPLRARKWCFTLNNYSEKEYNEILYYLKHKKHALFIVGKEVGSNGTPHLQGYIHCENAISFETLKNLNNRWHLEKARGNDKQNYEYCSKENNFETNMIYGRYNKQLQKWYSNVVWRPFQKEILKIFNTNSEDRKIYWIVDRKGCSGKTYLAKYILLKYKCIIGDGKKADVFHQIFKFFENNPNDEIDCIILDIPRHNENYLNYGMLETLKGGFLSDGKYEGGQIPFDPPHIIIFANFEPDQTKYTGDRWNIINLDEDPLGDC